MGENGMRIRWLMLGAVFALGGLGGAYAAVTADRIPPRTVRDLIAICGDTQEDPAMTAAVNYCHGFVEGASDVEVEHEGVPKARKLFCLPSPRPPSDQALSSFIAWANATPARLDQPAL